MLEKQLLLVISLLFGIVILATLSNRLKISYPILLVIGGLIISLIPEVPRIALKPDLIFLIFLPPLLFSSGWNLPWNEFWKFKRDISLMAFGLVIATSAVVALVSKTLIPGFTLASGFLLGSIIAPTDAVATTSILERLQVPKKTTVILEGESLINDACALVIFRFAIASILTSQFHFWNAAQSLVIVSVMGILTGLIIAIIIYSIHRILAPTISIEATITLIIPYVIYTTAEYFKFSGVLAVVAGSSFLSYRSHRIFSYASRLRIVGLWETLMFLINGMVFILIGLQLPFIIKEFESKNFVEAIIFSIIICIATILVRIIWVFASAYFPRFLFKSLKRNEPNPSWRSLVLIGWSGMRGVVSLASALAVPTIFANGDKFQHRNLILFITFIVILITVVLQGLSLKPVTRFLNIRADEKDSEKSQSIALRVRLAEAALTYLDVNYLEETQNKEIYKRVKGYYERVVDIAKRKLKNNCAKEEAVCPFPTFRQVLLELLSVRRHTLNNLRNKGEFNAELIRQMEWELDIEEARLKR